MKGFHMIFSGNRSISINSLVQLCIQCLLYSYYRAGTKCFHFNHSNTSEYKEVTVSSRNFTQVGFSAFTLDGPGRPQ